MPSNPYLIYGTILNSKGFEADTAEITFTISGSSQLTLTNSQGQYAFDLAELGYSSGNTVTYSAKDRFSNELFSGSFTVEGQNKNLDVTLSSRTSALVPPGNRNFQVFNIGGEAVSLDNPLPVTNGIEINSHAHIKGNVQTDFTITRSDGQPDSETVTLPDGTQLRRYFTYNASNRTIRITRWQKI